MRYTQQEREKSYFSSFVMDHHTNQVLVGGGNPLSLFLQSEEKIPISEYIQSKAPTGFWICCSLRFKRILLETGKTINFSDLNHCKDRIKTSQFTAVLVEKFNSKREGAFNSEDEIEWAFIQIKLSLKYFSFELCHQAFRK